jgi:predicted nuclease of predicted toxin-antitoxin system
LTSDLDFGELIAASGDKLPTVVIFRLRDMQPDNVNRHLLEILDHHSSELIEGAVFSISENSIRIRHLPIG